MGLPGRHEQGWFFLEPPKPQFRGVWIPEDILSDLINGKIKPKELALLAVIESLTSKDYDCYATNQEMAEMLGISKGSINGMIQALKKSHHIEQTESVDKRRQLRTSWSRK